MKSTRAIDQDNRIAEYVLGLCPAEEIELIQASLSRHDPTAACALKWEAYLLGICDSMVPIAPPPRLLARIQDALGHHQTQAATPAQPEPPTISPAAPPKPIAPPVIVEPRTASRPPEPIHTQIVYRSGPWRLLTLLLGITAIALGFFLAKALSRPEIPAVQIVQVAPTQVAILQAPGLSSTPGWLATVDTQGTVRLEPQVTTSIQPDEAVQLWTRQADGQNNRSLGLVDPNQAVTIPASVMGIVASGQIFEMTLERKGGSASGKPEGPILFIGQFVTFGVQSPSKPLA